ncbi:GNAT family N-acetyltransferase [Halobacillus sp. H74]|uniref:GNAT family N-acetyltransferase n=1 Tax=Halobacillus sp. H74 TaxID=3457436 RepID=UPI003FCE9236
MIHSVKPQEAYQYARLIQKLETESDFLLYGANERSWANEQVEQMIYNLHKKKNSTILVAENDGDFVGHVTVFGGGADRNAHVGQIITGVLEKFHGEGIAKQLFLDLDDWGVANGLIRLELSVMVHNERAVKFYERMGFEIEGTKRKSLVVHDEPVDEYVMAKILT